MTVMDPKQMNVAAAVWAVVSYVVADMEEMLPRSQKQEERNIFMLLARNPGSATLENSSSHNNFI